jgi:hypothetical protein
MAFLVVSLRYCQYVRLYSKGGRVINELWLGRILGRADRGTVLQCSWNNWGKHRKIINMVNVPDEIWTSHTPNTCLKCYSYSKALIVIRRLPVLSSSIGTHSVCSSTGVVYAFQCFSAISFERQRRLTVCSCLCIW